MISVGSVVQVYPGPPNGFLEVYLIPDGLAVWVFAMVGALAQLGEHLLCKQGVIGSIPISSTNRETWLLCAAMRSALLLSFEEIKVCITLMKS